MAMRRPGGFLICYSPDGVKQADTFTCGHCQRITVVTGKSSAYELGGQCRACMRLICSHCCNLLGCDVIEKKIERMETAGRRRAEMGLQ